METLRIVTTSWDDGYLRDFLIADHLHCRGLKGTFYVPFNHEKHRVLNESDVRSLRLGGFEIGGHGLSHLTLPSLSTEGIDREVRGCKDRLEDILGEQLDSFCYPRGRFSRRVRQRLRMAGYRAARTTRMLAMNTNFEPFAMPTSLQAYPHTQATYIKNLAKASNIRGLFRHSLRLRHFESWLALGKNLFDLVLRDGGIWHLYGHSWEIEELGLWAELREMLDYVAKRPGVAYLSNGDVSRLRSSHTSTLRDN